MTSLKSMKGEMENEKGYFLFSLDTELAWGQFDRFRPEMFSKDGQKERQNIKRILDILDQYNIIATWALVGHLLYMKCEKCQICPILDWKGKFPVFDSIYTNNNPLWYGADVCDAILSRKTSHEIALHSYTHTIFDIMTKEEAITEIEESIRVFERRNIFPKTIIFPRNKVAYLDEFQKYGFICYRGEELKPDIYKLPLIGRLFRRFYYYISALSAPLVFEGRVDSSGLVNLPSSRWLFGFNRNAESVLEALDLHTARIQRIVKGVEHAARKRKIIHIWAHPCEFRTEKDFEKLSFLFENVHRLVIEGSMQTIGMADLARIVLRQNNKTIF